MKIQTFYPVHSVLKTHIEYYYFQKTESPDFQADYYAYPNTLQALNIHKNISCNINSHTVEINGVEQSNYKMILQGRFQLPLHVKQKGKIDKLTIIFKPLGLNHFIKSPYLKVGNEATQVFTEWLSDENYITFLNQFYHECNEEKRIEILEDYLLLQYTSVKDASLLQSAIRMLSDFIEEPSVEEIAKKVQLNTRTFNRLFFKNLGVSPVAFRKIARFRNALKHKLTCKHSTLTKIGYESNFYDQSYFNKIYRQIANENPSSFFNSIDSLADNRLIFKFVDK